VVGYSTSSVAQLAISFALQFVQKVGVYDVYGKTSWKYSDIFTNLNYLYLTNKTNTPIYDKVTQGF
jgi:hypothetical protein